MIGALYMKVTWRRGLGGADHGERQSLLEAEIKAERVFAEEIVGRLCMLSRSGLSDCAALRVACRTRRWARYQSSLYSQLKCVAAHPAAERELNWRLPRVPGTRACVRTAAK